MTALAVAFVVMGLAACWTARDAWKRYLVAVDRTAGLKALEANLVARVAKIEQVQAQQARAIGVRALHQARMHEES